jgi:hypothetical protein
MNLNELSVRMNVLLATGDRAQVLDINADEETVRVRYLDALGQPELVDTDAWVSVDEVIAIDQGSHVEGAT